MAKYIWIFLFVHFFAASMSVPLSIVNVGSNVPVVEDELLDDDDSTTQTLERLSSAATCLVAGVEYTHGQQIYRRDPCEFCLCLDGEMFCWWQDCPPTLEGPCRERSPFSPCPVNGGQPIPNNHRSSQQKPGQPSSTIGSGPTTTTTTGRSEPPPASITTQFSDSTVDTSSSDTTDLDNLENSTASTVPTPKICVVMGRKYEIGAHLPHDTGNCVECICGVGAQVTCSPHQCAPLVDDINDYRPPGPRQPDVF